MKPPTNITRLASRLVLALVGLSVVPGYCMDLSLSGPVTKSWVTKPSWFPTDNLGTARTSHTATQLQNGKVLIVGGWDNQKIDDRAELYDPDTGLWSATGRLNQPRIVHTATLLPDGKVLVVAGNTSNAPPNFGRGGTAELYDPASGTWSLTVSLNAARSDHTATLLQSGKVLVAGGYGSDSLGSAELYDPASGSWSNAGGLNVARYGHTATLLQDGRVLIVGGSNDGDLASSLSGAELYDPVAGRWSNTGSLDVARYGHTATLLQTGKVLVVGGYFWPPTSLSSTELYDPAAGTWSNAGNLNQSRQNHTATLLPLGEVLVAGGYDWNSRRDLASSERYDAYSATWTTTGNLNTTRGSHTATLLPGGKVLVAGGAVVGPTYTNTALNSAEIYWAYLSPIPMVSGQWQLVFEFYNAELDHYFISGLQPDIDALDSGRIPGWKRTGPFDLFTAFDGPYKAPGAAGPAVPVCRFYIPPGSHFFSASADECAAVARQNPQFILETPAAFYAWLPDLATGNCPEFVPYATGFLFQPVYRLWNNRADTNHRYTVSLAIRTGLIAKGWVSEGYGPLGVAMCVPWWP